MCFKRSHNAYLNIMVGGNGYKRHIECWENNNHEKWKDIVCLKGSHNDRASTWVVPWLQETQITTSKKLDHLMEGHYA